MFEIILDVTDLDIYSKEQFSDYFLSIGAESVSLFSQKKQISIIAHSPDFLPNEFESYIITTKEIDVDHCNQSWFIDKNGFYINNCIYIQYINSKLPTDQIPYVITIDPTEAFGDGHHPTTKMCGKFLFEEFSNKHKDFLKTYSVLDVGCGTGVLGILACKLGASNIHLIDNNKKAIESTKRNLILNNIDNFVLEYFDLNEFNSVKKFKIIVANILTDVLEKNINKLYSLLHKNGLLICSGIGDTWQLDIERIFVENNLTIIKHESIDGWHAYMLVR